MKWEEAPDIQSQIEDIALRLEHFSHIQPSRIFCMRSFEAKTRAYARIWSFPKIFQKVLLIDPAYVIEIVSERYNKLDPNNKTKVLIHELLHIPKNFSGALLSHRIKGGVNDRTVKEIYSRYVRENR